MYAIESIVATTITVSERTRRRLADYKRGDMSYDDVLNVLMDRIPIEDLAAEQILEHYHRLRGFRGISAEAFKNRIQRQLRAGR